MTISTSFKTPSGAESDPRLSILSRWQKLALALGIILFSAALALWSLTPPHFHGYLHGLIFLPMASAGLLVVSAAFAASWRRIPLPVRLLTVGVALVALLPLGFVASLVVLGSNVAPAILASIGWVAAAIGLAVYTAARLGYFAPQSSAALAQLIGVPGRLERLLLVATSIGALAYVVLRIAISTRL